LTHRLLILLPCALDVARGNVTTAQRLAGGLKRHGFESLLAEAADFVLPEGFSPDVILAIHAENAAPQAQELAERLGVPYLVMFSGTDLGGKPRKEGLVAVSGASACVALGQSSADRAAEFYASSIQKMFVIPQSAVMPSGRPVTPQGLPDMPAANSGDPYGDSVVDPAMILVPAGIRKVKAQLRILKALQSLAEAYPGLRVWFAGPILEKGYGAEFQAKVEQFSWAEWLGEIPHEQMPYLYRKARLVLSASRAEGGPPNALLEAAMCSAPVAASNISAHKELENAAHRFGDDASMRRTVGKWVREPQRAARDGRDMREWVRTAFPHASEFRNWAQLIQRLLPSD